MKKWIAETWNKKQSMTEFFKNTKDLIMEHYGKIQEVLEESWRADLEALAKLEKL